VAQKGIKTDLSIDLTSFDNAEGNFTVLKGENNDVVTNFTGKKGVVNVEFTISNSGTYLIVKNNSIAAAIEVTDSLQTANLEDVRKKLINE
jgi:plastocyanin domain-containing protein